MPKGAVIEQGTANAKPALQSRSSLSAFPKTPASQTCQQAGTASQVDWLHKNLAWL